MRIAVYAGTFDPVTEGHLSVIRHAARLFDELIVLLAVNPDKGPLFSVAERTEMIAGSLGPQRCAIRIESTEGLVVEFARDAGATALVRGIRDATDAEYETFMAHFNRALAPDIETVFLPADSELSHVSSSGLKAMAARGEDGRAVCPAGVWSRLLERLGSERRASEEVTA